MHGVVVLPEFNRLQLNGKKWHRDFFLWLTTAEKTTMSIFNDYGCFKIAVIYYLLSAQAYMSAVCVELSPVVYEQNTLFLYRYNVALSQKNG